MQNNAYYMYVRECRGAWWCIFRLTPFVRRINKTAKIFNALAHIEKFYGLKNILARNKISWQVWIK